MLGGSSRACAGLSDAPRFPAGMGSTGQRLLLVEDDLDLAESIGDFLARRGWQVAHARHGALALRLAADAPAPVSFLNLGGGFGVPYFPGEQPLDLPVVGFAAPGFGTTTRLRLVSTTTFLVRPWLKLCFTFEGREPPRPSVFLPSLSLI